MLLEEQFRPIQDRYEDSFISSIDQKYISQNHLSKKGREDLKRHKEEISCRICHNIVNRLSAVSCNSCWHLLCQKCYFQYQKDDDARYLERPCKCKSSLYINVDEEHLHPDWFENFKFKCKFKNCNVELTYDEMIDSTFHNDCPSRIYECQYCKARVENQFRQKHRLECKRRPKKCEYCGQILNHEQLEAHVQRYHPNGSGTRGGDQDQLHQEKLNQQSRLKDELLFARIVSEERAQQENGTIKRLDFNDNNFCSEQAQSGLGTKETFSQRFEVEKKFCETCQRQPRLNNSKQCSQCQENLRKRDKKSQEKIMEQDQIQARSSTSSLKEENEQLKKQLQEYKKEIEKKEANIEMLRQLLQEKQERNEQRSKEDNEVILEGNGQGGLVEQKVCTICQWDIVNVQDDKVSFCKQCIQKLIQEKELFSLQLQCDRCEEVVQASFTCKHCNNKSNNSKINIEETNVDKQKDKLKYKVSDFINDDDKEEQKNSHITSVSQPTHPQQDTRQYISSRIAQNLYPQTLIRKPLLNNNENSSGSFFDRLGRQLQQDKSENDNSYAAFGSNNCQQVQQERKNHTRADVESFQMLMNEVAKGPDSDILHKGNSESVDVEIMDDLQQLQKNDTWEQSAFAEGN